MDADAIPIKSDQATAWKGSVPIIALIGTETPSRLKWLLDCGRRRSSSSRCVRPAFTPALVVAFDSAHRRIDEAAHIEKLEDRIRSRRVVFAAVLQIHARSRYVGDRRVCAYSADRNAASHDDRDLVCGNHRRRRHAEPDAAVCLTGPNAKYRKQPHAK
jgi:hypothetical protein